MASKTSKPVELLPGDVLGHYVSAVSKAVHITPVDAGAVALGYRLAKAINVAFDEGDLANVALLSPKLLGVLQDLRLTVKTRTEASGEQTRKHEPDFTGDYLRLITSKN